jgi:hypothetical protein
MLVCFPGNNANNDCKDNDNDQGQDELLLSRFGLVPLGQAQLLCSLVDSEKNKTV